jgi:hypothetical protein
MFPDQTFQRGEATPLREGNLEDISADNALRNVNTVGGMSREEALRRDITINRRFGGEDPFARRAQLTRSNLRRIEDQGRELRDAARRRFGPRLRGNFDEPGSRATSFGRSDALNNVVDAPTTGAVETAPIESAPPIEETDTNMGEAAEAGEAGEAGEAAEGLEEFAEVVAMF